MRIHTGVGTLTVSQHNIFDSEKLSQICLVLVMLQGSNLVSLDLESDSLPTSHPVAPNYIQTWHDGPFMDALYAHARFDDIDLDARSQWVGKGKKSALHAVGN